MHNSQFQQPVTKFELVSTTIKNQFELVTASFNHKEKPVWVSFLREPVCLCHAQQLVSTTSHNQFWASFNNQEEPVLS